MPLTRISRRTLTLALVASPALLLTGAPVAAQEASPAAEELVFVSEQFGYEIAWPETWTLVQTDSELDGYDMVELVRDDATALIIISRPGDTPLSDIVEFLSAGPDDRTFVPGMVATDQEGSEILGETPDRAWGAWEGNYVDEDIDGFMEFRYAEIRRLEGDLAVGLSYAIPAGDFDGDVAPFSALLDGVTKIEGTPVAG